MARIVTEKRRDVHFVVIGDGSLRPDIERWISETGLDSNVTLTGNLTEIREALADLDVVALTSLSEGTPVSLIEAMAAGCPVISTAVGGVPNLIDHGVDGVLVDFNDPETPREFAIKLLALRDDPNFRERLASAAREKVRSIYTVDRLAEEIADLYRRCLPRE
jgi:glycosyltransferase involved in cell wall biosynthesis